MKKNQYVLILDDEEGFRIEVSEYLKNEGYHVYSAGNPSTAIDLLESKIIDIALLDIRLPEMDGITFLKKINQQYPYLGVIMMTGYGEMSNVIQAMRYGAVDFLNKPFKLNEVKESIERINKYQTIRKESESKGVLNDTFDENYNIIGKSKAISEIRNLIQKIAGVPDTTVLITGESGTGKELVAKAIHLLSKRKDNRFIPVNCSTIPEELFENEFFGHKKGSYTDARQDQKGIMEIADKGTLFLDEIGDMKQSMQSKLLRVIEDKKISRLGDYNEKKVDIRIVTATNQNLEGMVKQKLFRADLFHRLNLFRIDIPPLRERKEDIPVLFDHFVKTFIKKYGKPILKVEKSISSKLLNYDFEGNVRELMNLIERAIILCDEKILTENRFHGLKYFSQSAEKTENEKSGSFNLGDQEKQSIKRALNIAGHNKSKAADLLNISRQALDRKLKKYNISIKK
ncbi:MAG: sigma-54 dependent transcriptional regulator [Bacteroidales bacterium]|nr:sigma-54 dependent transcriptional regulator [Bacteroidales bacterium]